MLSFIKIICSSFLILLISFPAFAFDTFKISPNESIGRFDPSRAPVEPATPAYPPGYQEPIPPGDEYVAPPAKPEGAPIIVEPAAQNLKVRHEGKNWVLYQGKLPSSAVVHSSHKGKPVYKCLTKYKGKYYQGKLYGGSSPCYFNIGNKTYTSKWHYVHVK